MAIFCVRYVKSQLYEITSVSVPVMTIAIAVLVSAAAIAGVISALRAASIDPYARGVQAEVRRIPHVTAAAFAVHFGVVACASVVDRLLSSRSTAALVGRFEHGSNHRAKPQPPSGEVEMQIRRP